MQLNITKVLKKKKKKQARVFIRVGAFISSAVFEENFEVMSCVVVRRHAKTWTFSNISVLTEDIYWKLRVVVHYQKGNPYQ